MCFWSLQSRLERRWLVLLLLLLLPSNLLVSIPDFNGELILSFFVLEQSKFELHQIGVAFAAWHGRATSHRLLLWRLVIHRGYGCRCLLEGWVVFVLIRTI